MNPDLQLLLKNLLGQYEAINSILANASKAEYAKIAAIEAQEILHRINIIQALLSKKVTNSQQLASILQEAKISGDELTAQLSNLKKLPDILSATSGYLSAVDAAIDFIKIAALEGDTGTDAN